MWPLCRLPGICALGWPGSGGEEGDGVRFEFTRNKMLMMSVYVVWTVFQGRCWLFHRHLESSFQQPIRHRDWGWGGCNCYVHFVDEETEAQRD